MIRRDPLRLRQPKIATPMHDQHRRPPPLHKLPRIILLQNLLRLRIPRSAAPFLLEKVELVGAEAVVRRVEHAVVAEERGREVPVQVLAWLPGVHVQHQRLSRVS